jgi:hypothetical protein
MLPCTPCTWCSFRCLRKNVPSSLSSSREKEHAEREEVWLQVIYIVCFWVARLLAGTSDTSVTLLGKQQHLEHWHAKVSLPAVMPCTETRCVAEEAPLLGHNWTGVAALAGSGCTKVRSQ